MKLIVGLGNPGRIYVNTRHNIGSAVVYALAKQCGSVLKKDRSDNSYEGKGIIEDKEVVLAVPLTYMNLSGRAVSSLIKKYKIVPHDLLVVSDDLDLELGRIKVKAKGSSAGHRGVVSIIESLGTEEFPRLRLGIGRPYGKEEASEFVLSRFKRTELKIVHTLLEEAMDCCQAWIKGGIAKCMEKYNSRERGE
jgi:PTH1 family peptidyl-tRNA hydrolase